MAKKICPDCDGTGKIKKPLSHSEMSYIDCETCEGTGWLPSGNLEEQVIERLDKIIALLEKK